MLENITKDEERRLKTLNGTYEGIKTTLKENRQYKTCEDETNMKYRSNSWEYHAIAQNNRIYEIHS